MKRLVTPLMGSLLCLVMATACGTREDEDPVGSNNEQPGTNNSNNSNQDNNQNNTEPGVCDEATPVADLRTGAAFVCQKEGDEWPTDCQAYTLCLVATSPVYEVSGDLLGFFAEQDPAAADRTNGGIAITFKSSEMGNITVEPGTPVVVHGEAMNYYGNLQISVSSYNEGTIETESSTVAVEPLVVDPAVLTATTTAEPYEGVLVRVENVLAAGGVNGYGEFPLEGGPLVDDTIYAFAAQAGQAFLSITGPVTFGFDHYRILPRFAEDVVTDGEPPAPDTATIQAIQDPGHADHPACLEEGTACAEVVLENVLVTSPVFNSGKKFFIMDLDATAPDYRGVMVFNTNTGLTLPEQGDIITIAGTPTEYNGLTELGDITSITIHSSGNDVTPFTVAIADGTDATAMEPYEGVLITVENVTATSDPDQYNEFSLDNGLIVDDAIYDVAAQNGASYTALTGLVDFSYDSFKLLPRSPDDVVTDGEPPVTGGASIQAIQDPGHADHPACLEEGTACAAVVLENVLVTSPVFGSGKNFSIMDPNALVAEYSGVMVYNNDTSLPTVQQGDLITIAGTPTEYNGLTELGDITSITVHSSGNAVTPFTVTITDGTDATAMEPYEGVLITVENVTATSDPNQYNEFSLSNGLLVDDAIYQVTAQTGTSFTALMGLVDYSYGDFKLLPRSATDVVQ